MELTPGQMNALVVASKRYKEGHSYTTIVGPAGTGKTTVVRYIIRALGVDENEVVYATYTGKAAKVLQNKGNKQVSTLHKLLYDTHQNPDGTYTHIPKKAIEYSVVVCDECSMIPEDMLNLLLGYPNIYVIFLGDDAQLPPVKGKLNWLFDKPHARLVEIVRQEHESEIIKYSTDVRLGQPLPNSYNGEEVRIFPNGSLTNGMLEWADIVLCATNNMRRTLNMRMRERKGFAGEPKVGDKIICCRNDWDIIDDDGNPLVNGTIGYIVRIETKFWPIYSYYKIPNNKIEYYEIDFKTEEGTMFYCVPMDKQLFLTGETTLTPEQSYKIARNKKLKSLGVEKLQQFEFAYAISTWKAQGSEWDKVLVIEEPFPYGAEHEKFLYTSLTRAKNKLVLISK